MWLCCSARRHHESAAIHPFSPRRFEPPRLCFSSAVSAFCVLGDVPVSAGRVLAGLSSAARTQRLLTRPRLQTSVSVA